MRRWVEVTCPSCAANLRIDPDLQVASCSHCSTSSFVQTARRRAPAEVRSGGFVIDITAHNPLPWLLGLGAMFVAFSLVTWWYKVQASEAAAARSAASTVSVAAPLAVSGEPPPAVPAETEPGTSSRPRSLNRSSKPRAGKVSVGAIVVSGRLREDVVRRIVRLSFGRIRNCYDQGLSLDETLEGKLTMRFVIGRDGSVSSATPSAITLGNDGVVRCTAQSFMGLRFPKPEGGIVVVSYPLQFSLDND